MRQIERGKAYPMGADPLAAMALQDGGIDFFGDLVEFQAITNGDGRDQSHFTSEQREGVGDRQASSSSYWLISSFSSNRRATFIRAKRKSSFCFSTISSV